MTSWKISADPIAANAEASALALEDKLLAELADVQFDSTPAQAHPPTVVPPQAVPPLPVHTVDPEYQAVHAALQAGTIPTFAEEPGTTAVSASAPIDVAAEREAYAALLAFIHAHKEPNTTVTFIDPDDFARGLT